MIYHRRILVAGLFVWLFFIGDSSSPLVLAQRRGRVSAIALAPSPKSVLGFAPGDDRTIADWGQITDYFARLDKASDRVLIHTIGESTLKRPMIVAFISARENLLAGFRTKRLNRAFPALDGLALLSV